MHKRILLISPFFSPNTGGVETFLDDLIVYLNKRSQPVSVLAYQPLTTKAKGKMKEKKGENIIYRLPWLKFNLFYRLEKYPLLQLLYLGSGLGILSFFHLLFFSLRYKTINCHGLAAGFIGYLLSFLFKKRYVLTIHTNYRFSQDQIIGRFVKKMSARYNKILVLSDACRDNFIQLGIDPGKVVRYFNWVEEELYVIKDKSASRQKIGWRPDAFYALFVGRFSKEKGIFELLKAIPLVNREIQLVIIGGGVNEEMVSEVANKNDNVEYLGRVAPEALADYFNAADILMYAPVDEDYLGRTAISALECGLPIMICSQSEYGGKVTDVTIQLPATIGVTFAAQPEKFADALNDLFLSRKADRFDSNRCRDYALGLYGKEVNGEIHYDNLK